MIKVRINGTVVHLPTLKGVNGKSAYEYAVEAGYTGTEQEFAELLINGSGAIDNDAVLQEAKNYTDTAIENAIANAIAASY